MRFKTISALFSHAAMTLVAGTLLVNNADDVEAAQQKVTVRHDALKLDTSDPVMFLQYGDKANPYQGFVEMCERNPEECSFKAKTPGYVVLDTKFYELIGERNRVINENIGPADDEYNSGQSEYWSQPGETADCEDYVLVKMQDFNETYGIPRSAMSIVGVMDTDGGGHAIGVIRTDKGDVIFDNLDDELRFPSETDYTFVKATSFTNIRNWQEMKVANPRDHIPAIEDPIQDLIEQSQDLLQFPDTIKIPPPRPKGP